MREQRADEVGGVDVVGRHEVRDAVARVDLRAAQLGRGDALARDPLDDLPGR